MLVQVADAALVNREELYPTAYSRVAALLADWGLVNLQKLAHVATYQTRSI